MYLTKFITKLFALTMLFAVILCAAFHAYAGSGKKNQEKSKQTALWREVDKNTLPPNTNRSATDKYLVFSLNKTALNEIFAAAPLEFTEAARQTETILEIPMPDGTFARFRIEQTSLLAPEIAARFPTWKYFAGQGIDDPTATASFDFNENGFHGYVSGASGTFLIDPVSLTDKKNYVVYYKGDIGGSDRANFSCNLRNDKSDEFRILSFGGSADFTNGPTLRTFKLAVSATKEYTNFFGGNQNAAFAAIGTTVSRMNVIYRRDLATSFTLVSDTRTVFTNANDGGFPVSTASTVAEASLDRNQIVLDTTYGNANYDIGHVLAVTPNPNGLAASPSLCDNTAKAQGFTGAQTPQGDGFDVDYVAHEIGHQFSMSHTFNNDIDGSCNTRSINSAYEPASGITIMGYGGICAPRNLAANSIEFFNLRSFDQALNYLQTTIPAQYPTCGQNTNSGNQSPTVTAQGTFNIPKQTPFTLTASASDTAGQTLTYLWEEFDLNANGATGSVPNPTPSPTPGGNPPRNNMAIDTDEDGTIRPIFRAYNATTSPSRTFPSLYYILNNANVPPLTYTGTLPFAPTTGSTNGYVCAAGETCVTGERLPSISRTMNFRVTVRDNVAGSGGVADGATSVVVNAAAGPFQITTQNTATTWQAGTLQTITWDVAGTTANGINAALVNIQLSIDGGQTFPITLSQNTPNDGSEPITIPNIPTTTARIKIQPANNIFFDINNAAITISAPPTAIRAPFDFDGDGRTDVSVFRPSNGTWYLQGSAAGFSAIQFGEATDLIAPADFDGDGKTDIAVFRPSNGTWYRINSATNTYFGVQFGQNGDLPRPADFDGDGKADINVFRPSNGTWYRLNSSNGQFTPNQFGQTGDIPVVGDYNGDGKADLAVFRPSAGQWYVARSTGVPAQNFDVVNFGAASDIPVPANYDGDTKTDVAVFRPSNGTWYRINSGSGQSAAVQFGQNGDVPVVGDYDGDTKADFAVFRPSTGAWYGTNSQSGSPFIQFGATSDKPVPSAFVGQ